MSHIYWVNVETSPIPYVVSLELFGYQVSMDQSVQTMKTMPSTLEGVSLTFVLTVSLD